MADWTLEDALAWPYKVSLLYQHQSCKARMVSTWGIYTLLRSRLLCRCMPVSIEVLEKWVEGGSFNPECMAEGDYSCSTAILIVLNPNVQGTALESTCIRLVVCQHKAPVGKIAKVLNLIKYAHSLMEVEGQSSEPVHRMICTMVGNYGGHMAFTMDPPFCTTYPLSFTETDDPTQMTFRHQHIQSSLLHRRLFNGASVAHVGLPRVRVCDG